MRGDDTLIERDRGFLTEHDRRYLAGELDTEEWTDNYEQQKRYQIRERFRHAMYDFHVITEHLSSQDKQLLWPEIDEWLWRSRKRRETQEDFTYPEPPLLAECWRDIVSLFVECHVQPSLPEAEQLALWVLEQGANKGVRRKLLRVSRRYQEVDAELDWGVGETMKLFPYLNEIGRSLPADSEAAKDELQSLVREGYLLEAHAHYCYRTYVAD